MSTLLGKPDYALVPTPVLHEYQALDADATKRVYVALREEFKDEKSLKRYYDNYLKPLTTNLMEASIRGLYVNKAEINKVIGNFEHYETILEGEIFKEAGGPFNIGSRQQLSKILYEDFDYPVLGKTDTGLPSTKGDILEELYAETGKEFIRNIIEYRSLKDCRSKQVDGFLQFADKKGFIHPQFKTGGTVSGRVSASNPPSTTVPRDRDYSFKGEPVAVHLRNFYSVPDDSWEFGFVDIRQAELVVIAILSGDETMLDIIKKGEDIHEGSARIIYTILGLLGPGDPVLPLQRKICKTVNFAIAYGGQPEGTAQKTGLDVEAVTIFKDQYFKTFKGIARFASTIGEIGLDQGYLESPFGRRRRVMPFSKGVSDEFLKRRIRQMGNFLPQESAAAVCYNALNRICARFRKEKIIGWPVNTVYDSIEFLYKKVCAEKAREIILEEMLRPVPELDNHVFSCSMGTGSSWGEAEHAAVDHFTF